MVCLDFRAVLWLLLGTVCSGYYFEHGYDHYYTYSAKSNLLGLHDVTTIMKFRVRPINQTDQGSTLHRLFLDSFIQHSQDGYMMENPMRWNLSKSFLFRVDTDGLVTAVHYPTVDDREVISLKKVLSSVLSAKRSDGHLTASFENREIDHAGDLDHTYHVTRKPDGLVVKRLHQSSEHVKRTHNKTLHYDQKGTIHFVASEDKILLHNDKKSTRNRTLLPGEAKIDDTASGEFPTISTSSLSHIKLTLKRKHENIHPHGMDENMVEDILIIKELAPEKKKLEEVNDTITSLLTCIRSHENKFHTNRTDCVSKLRETLNSLDDEEYHTLAEEALKITCDKNDTQCTDHRKLFIDLVARKGNDQSQLLIIRYFLSNKSADEHEVHRCLFHCIALKTPREDLINAIEKLCFGDEDSLHGSQELAKTQRRACLTLSALCKTIHQTQSHISNRIVNKLESWLGHHDEDKSSKIVQVRKKRSVTEVDHVRKNHIVTKMVLIHALGNAGLNRSLDHLLSYMKPNQGVTAWRRAAIHGLRHFSCNRSASSLLYVSVHDYNDVVRDEAYDAFNQHPKGKYLTQEHKDLLSSKRYTYPLLMRLKRGLFEADFRDGIYLAIKLPGIDWVKTIGNRAIGASFGLVIKNEMELELKILQGHFSIDVYDTAFAEAHVGLINFQVDIFRALMCYKGHIGYDLNVLKDFGINDIQDLANIFDKIMASFVDPVVQAVETFKKLIQTFQNGGIQKMFNRLVEVIKNFPQILTQIVKNFIQFVLNAVQFGKIPWIEQIKTIVQKIKAFVGDVQEEIMGFYHSIVDIVVVQIPYIGKKILDAIVTIVSSMKHLLTNPMQAFTGLTKAIMDIKLSISMFIEVKNKIMDACLFLTGKAPFWQQFGQELDEIIDEIKVLRDMLAQMFNPQGSGSEQTSLLADGISSIAEKSDTIKDMFMKELANIFAPLNVVLKIAEPFLEAYKSIMDVVHQIKSAFENLRDTVNKGKSMVQKIFGPKFSIKFPTHRRDEKAPCGQGVWPTTSGDIYKTTGVDVMIGRGSSVVCPVNAFVSRKGPNQLLIEPSDEDFAQYQIIIDNVKSDGYVSSSERTYFEAGKKIGKAQRSKCSPNFIHVAMRKAAPEGTLDEDGDYVDPSPYLDRIVPIPQWIEECNDHYFKHIGSIFESGALDEAGAQEQIEDIKREVGGRMDEFANMEPEDEPPYRPEGINVNSDKDIDKSFQDSMSNALSSFGSFGNIFKKGGKLPNILDIIDINKFSIKRILGIISQSTSCPIQLHELVGKLSKKMKDAPTLNPETLSVSELIDLFSGNEIKDRSHMIADRLQQAEKECSTFNGTIIKGHNHICTAHKDCQGLKCSISLEYGTDTKLLNVDIRVDTCKRKVYITKKETTTINLDGVDHSINLGDIGFDHTDASLTVSGEVDGDQVLLSIDASLCVKQYLSCLPEVSVLSDTRFPHSGPCEVSGEDKDPSILGTEAMTLQEFMRYLSIYNLMNRDVLCLVNTIRDNLMEKLFKDPRAFLNLQGSEFPNKMDFCVDVDIPVPPLDIPFFDVGFLFFAGPVPFRLSFGASGSIGVSITVGACFLSLSTRATVTPWVGGKVYGSLAVDIGFARGGIRLTGYLIETRFPITGTIGFSKFPLDVTSKMDMFLTPVRFELKAFAEIFLIFKTITVFDSSIWKYKAPTIHKNIFTIPKKGEDKSPPEIMPSSVNNRRKRSGPRGCQLKQLKGRNPTDTAFMIEMAVQDEVSQVKLFYAIGTQRGGTNVQDWTEMGGSSLLVPTSSLPNKIPLYWTVKAGNSQGLFAYTHCMLNTFDNDAPDGRVDPSYIYSSHPSKLSATVVAFDDSPLVDTHSVALGLSPGQYGSEVKIWQPFSLQHTSVREDETSDLKYFSVPREGKLVAESFGATMAETPELCAKECLKYATKCVAFNYEYHSEKCDLNQVVEGPDAKLRISGTYKYFERLGIGHASLVEYQNLGLKHGTMYYINAEVTNDLGYKAYLTSSGTTVDFTPPETGPLGESYTEIFRADGCNASYRQRLRCIDVTSRANHRIIRDGQNAKTVFNGHKPLQDVLYTLSNHYVSVNFDGFKDNETGIWGYSWAVGRSICGTDLVDFNDPHALLSSRKFWTYTGYDKSVHLEDGKYYTTVQALNNVVFGGALVTTVCHTTPFTVDTTPPIFEKVSGIMFDEDFDILGVYFRGHDDLSKIARVDFGLGKTKYDVMVQGYSSKSFNSGENPYFVVEDLGLEPGVPAWIRVRLANNVELFTAGHGDEPILIDKTAPIIGHVLDGDTLKRDATYQSDDSRICAQWIQFFDPESGIQEFIWGVGLKPGLDNIVAFHNFTHSQKQSCADVRLQHNVTYFSTVIAINDALNSKSSNTSSNGVLIDITPPEPGFVLDGKDVKEDIQFSSESATKWCNWNNFTDPESHIDRYEVSVFVNNDKIKTFEVTNVTSFTDHSIPMKHLDDVEFNVNAIDGAGLSVLVSSDGFKIDHTAPIMTYILDTESGDRYQKDMTSLNLKWNFYDSESGIKEYRYFINENAEGMKQKIWPHNTKYEIVAPVSPFATQIHEVLGSLTLTNGGKYSVHVTAVNQALMSTTHESEGVIVDQTPPNIKKVLIAMPLEDEELDDDGYVLHSDPNHMAVTWQGRDAESDIKHIFVGIGLSPGDTNETDGFLTFGNERSIVIDGLNLDVTAESSKIYYVTLKAENGAGIFSDPVSSKPIKVLKANIPGMLFDGRDRFNDKDYAFDKTSIGMTFSGFESEACNIVGYEWAIGMSPYMSDVMPFTDYGIVMLNSTHGQAQIHIQLYEGSTYYTTVRARTGHNCHEEFIVSSSDGIKIDSRKPNIMHIQPPEIDNRYKESRGSFFQSFGDSVNLSFNISDNSPIKETEWSIGSLPMLDDVKKWTENSIASLSSEHLVLHPGSSVFLNVKAEDEAGNINMAYSNAVIPDITSPVINEFMCTKYISMVQSSVTCTWRSIEEYESIIENITIDLGTRENGQEMASSLVVSKHRNSWTRDLHDNLKMHSTIDKIFVTLRARNILGQIKSSHFEIVVDKTPPTSGVVEFVTRTDDKEIYEKQRCQIPWTYVEIMIKNIVDTESDIERVEVSLGSKPQQSDIREFMTVNISKKIFIGHLSLKFSSLVYATARVYNKAGLYQLFFSEPVAISPYPRLNVFDGSDPEIDSEFQTDLSAIYGHWNYSDPCPIQKVQWSVSDLAGSIIKDFTQILGNGEYFYNDELRLENGKIYFSTVRTWDSLDRMLESSSNGVTVRIQPPSLGHVRDGTDDDINYQEETSELSANWDGFGDPTSTNPIQTIAHYEVAIGNDRRYAMTRTNIHYFENVGLNRSHTFFNLNLTAKTEEYFITVRAYSRAGSYQEGYSNGIKVGFSDDIIPGRIDVKFAQSNNNSISLSWSDFESDIGISKYRVGLGSKQFHTANNTFSCAELSYYDHEFDVKTPVEVGLNTMYTLSNLELVHGRKYYPVVIAVSESNMCAVAASYPVTIDMTPPLSSNTKIVLNDKTRLNETLIYVMDTEKLKVDWNEFTDPESGIQYVITTLLSIDGCPLPNHDSNTESIVSELKILNETKATFYDLFLLSGQYYVVRLTAVNNAGLSQVVHSSVFRVDISPPFSGTVRIGPHWNTSTSFQLSTDRISGWTAIAKSESTYACESQVDILHDKNMWLPVGNPYDTTMVERQEHDAVIVKIGINRRRKLVKGGLYTAEKLQLKSGNYSVMLKSAKGKKIVTTFSMASSVDIKPVDFQPPTPENFDSIEFNITRPEINDDETNSTTGPNLNQSIYQTSPTSVTLSSLSTERQTFPPSQNNDSSGYSKVKEDSYAGFGFHILGERQENSKSWDGMFWAIDKYKSVQQWFSIELDPTEGQSEYIINVKSNTLPGKVIWNLELLLNGEAKSQINGMHFPENLSIFLSTWNKDNYVPPITDIFDVFQAQAESSKIKIPLAERKPCLDGSGFYDGESGIKEIWLAVSNGLNDTENVKPFTLFKKVCTPCEMGCNFGCDINCLHTSDDFEIFNLDVNNLMLTPTSVDQPFNETEKIDIAHSSTFYLNVKMVNNAGVEAVATSNGIMVDTTPPTCEYIRCTDPLNSIDQPTSYLGSNKTIGAYWSCDEDISQIVNYIVSVGTNNGSNDMLSGANVGLQSKVALNLSKDIFFEHDKVYFVNMKVTNEAGSSSVHSCNITVKLYPPEVTNVATQNMFSTPPPVNIKIPASLSSKNDRTGVSWNNKHEDVEFYEWKIGSNPDGDDILPRVKVGYSKAGNAAIVRGHLWLNDTNMNKTIAEFADINWTNQNIDDVKKDSTFIMEPGRCLYHSLYAVGYSHLSSLIDIQPTCIKRPDDVILSSGNKTNIHIVMDDKGQFVETSQAHTSNDQLSISIKTSGESGGAVIGKLNSTDMQYNYGTSASGDYLPYIVDPEATKQYTTRLLRQRLKAYTGLSFFLAPTGSLRLTDLWKFIKINPNEFDNDTLPVLAVWVEKEEKWYHVEEECGIENLWNRSNTLTSHVCLKTLDGNKEVREKRDVTQAKIKPKQFGLFKMTRSYTNTAPVIDTHSITMVEDTVLTDFSLQWHDNENDCVQFFLEPGQVKVDANITLDGNITVTPEKDYSGEIKLKVRIQEVPCSSSSSSSNMSNIQEISLVVAEDNDEPDGFYFINDTVWIDTAKNGSFDILFIANDTSYHDLGIFIVGDVDVNDTLSILTDVSNNTVAKFSTASQSTGLISYIFPHSYRSVKGISISLELSKYFHGHLQYSVLGMDRANFTTSLLKLNIYSLWSPCVYGQCAERRKGIPCVHKSRAFSFDDFRCECTPGYQGQWCESEIDECRTVPCPLMYDCHDEINAYTCTINAGKLMGILAGIAVLIGMIVVLWRKFKRNKVYSFDDFPFSDSGTYSKSIELKQTMTLTPDATVKDNAPSSSLEPDTLIPEQQEGPGNREWENDGGVIEMPTLSIFAAKPGIIPRNVTGKKAFGITIKQRQNIAVGEEEAERSPPAQNDDSKNKDPVVVSPELTPVTS